MAVSCLVSIGCLVPAVAAAQELSPAAQNLAQCVQTNHRLSVLMLIDESGSLRATDPEAKRVDGVRAALTGLAGLAETPIDGTKPEVSVLMAGFYAKAHPDPSTGEVGSGAWKLVNRDSIDILNASAGDYARLNNGRATDYGTALLAAQQLLKERLIAESAGGVAPPCQALIWFTDGRYALPQRVGKAGVGLPKTVPYAPGIRLDRPGAGERAVAAGKQMMCKPGGLMDELADSGVTRFTVVLSSQLSPADASFLDAATTGNAGARRCGTKLSPRTGEYLDAGDSDSLFFAFGGLLSVTPPPHVNDVCPALSCVRGVTRFTTVPGLSQFLIRASSGVEGASLSLSGPGGDSARLIPRGADQVSLSGTEITARWVSSTAVEVQGEFDVDSPGWVGDWSYQFIDPGANPAAPPAQSRSSVQLFTDLAPVIDGERILIRGIPTKLTFRLERPGEDPGSELSSGPLLDAASITASVEDPVSGASTAVPVAGPNKDGEFSAEVTVPEDSSAGIVYLSLTSHLVIPGGTPVAPQYRSYEIHVRFPPGQGYPTVSPSSLNLDPIEGDSGTRAELTVTGSSVAGGCAWIGDPDLEAPGQVTATSEAAAPSARDCLQVGKGEERTVGIEFSSGSSETGEVSGTIPIHLSSEAVSGERTISVPVSFAISSPPDAIRRDALLVALILFGTLFPLLFLHLLNYWNARFTGPQDLLVLCQDAQAGSSGLVAEVAPEYTAFEPLTMEGESQKVRALEIDQLHLRTVASGSLPGLFRGPYGVAEAAGGGPLVAGSSGALRSWRSRTCQEVPLSLAGTWFFLPEPVVEVEEPHSGSSDLWGDATAASTGGTDGERVHGRLIFVIANGGDPELGEELLASADRALRDEGLREELVSSKTAEEEDEPAKVPVAAADPSDPGDSVTDDDDPWA